MESKSISIVYKESESIKIFIGFKLKILYEEKSWRIL